MTFPKSREFVKSLDHALFHQEKKQQELKIKHERTNSIIKYIREGLANSNQPSKMNSSLKKE